MHIRPVAASDLGALETLIEGAGVGITSLAVDHETLKARVDRALRSFESVGDEPKDEDYLFVLEDTAKNRVAGMCAIKAAVGLQEAFYSYRLGTVMHASKRLNVHKALPALYLTNDYTGCSELSSLYLAPDYRGGRLGVLLSKSRLLFMAQFRQRFADKVIVEIRGVSDDAGRSPFWDGLGRHFFGMDFPQADYLVGTGEKAFIAELMPKHPIYVLFLPEAAQRVIGEVHANSAAARRMLEAEGFRYQKYVDIFDAGPTLECRLEDIGAVGRSRSLRAASRSTGTSGARCLVANDSVRGFRCLTAEVGLDEPGCAKLDGESMARLEVALGDSVRVLEL